MESTRLYSDFLIIGSGIAGLSAALRAADHGSVILVTKREINECNTKYAQGGIACVLGADDSFAEHLRDTLDAGAGLCVEDVVQAIVKDGPARIKEMLEMGMSFTRCDELPNAQKPSNEYGFDLAREGGHRKRRILHAGDITGREIVRVLLEKCCEHRNITIKEDCIAIDLVSNRHLYDQVENAVMGAYVMERHSQKVKTIISKFTFLATGGAGKVYLYTSNPDIASGDGIAMAYRAFAQVTNMEFFQFHPTCMFHPHAKSFLISEAVRGEGAELLILRDDKYEKFMTEYHEMGSLAPRDVVARAIDNELKRSGQECVYLDIRHHDEIFLRKRFPNIFEKCLEYGVNMAQELVPVVPAAHYCCGGIKTDINGCSSVKNLYAIGEVGSTGLHGANRLASNSLLEAVVVAHNAVKHALELLSTTPQSNDSDIDDWCSGDSVDSDEAIVITHNWDEIRRFMWDYVGIVRTDKRLERAKSRIRLLRKDIEKYYWDFTITPDLIELRNLASVAEMIIDSALARKESIGLHYNLDYLNSNIPSMRDTILQRPPKAVRWSKR